MSGLQFLVKFTQPQHTRSMKKREEREEWWANSKRLQPSALVCLLDPKGVVVFCTVANPERRKPPNGNHQPQKQLFGSLSDDPSVASVVLELAEPNEANWGHIIDCHFTRKTQSSLALVEFPGILLPSFQPTLLALQKMSKAGNLPMSDILAPGNLDSPSILSDVPPPLYATAPGFSFDLKCLMNDSSNLELRPSEPPDIDRLKQKSSLDDAQASALARTIQRQLGLIQGPPGTGKSFTGVALIKVLLANKTKIKNFGPIICVCYTNHALDQLLEDVLENDPSLKIVRIGSQSKSEAIQKLNLRVMVKELEKTKLEKMEQFKAHSNLERGEKDFQNLHINSIGTDISLKHYLMKHDRVHYNQLFGVDDEGFQLQSGKGPRNTTIAWLSGGGSGGAVTRSVKDLAKVHVNSMTAEERQLLYAHWISNQENTVLQDALDLLSLHSHDMDDKNKIGDELDLRCLRDVAVVGVTTSGLARNMNMLRGLPSKVLICEEAGEVLEAHLLVSILPSIEQVILIGDHQQLRPQVQNYDLSREKESGKQYSLDRSLFERLVDPDDGIGVQLPYATLETQRRMHPSISRLIRETLYPHLHDAPLVHDYPEVVGMRKRLFWFDHRHPEAGASQKETFTQSHWNQYEVDMTVSVVNHLLSQGVYQKDDIAVLTPYLGQLHRLRRELSRCSTITLDDRDAVELNKAGFMSHKDDIPASQPVSKTSLLRSLRVATIDNFQGEEAKIVVISLVRSNSENKTGFLRTPNRINVLLSRAKHGMYIIGNSLTSRSVEMWDSVIRILESEGNIGSNLELACPRHPETPISVSNPNHFSRFSPEGGGCTLQCKDRLSCGHPCKQKCHSEILHNAAYCSEPCPRLLKGCSHSCQNRCGDRCPLLCKVPVVDNERILPCGHPMVDLLCWQAQDLQTVKCTVQLTKQISRCKHNVTVECHTDVEHEDYRCPAPCGGYLPCGHICKDSCWECLPQNVGGLHTQNADCKQVCNRPYSTCSHRCTARCHGEVPCAPCKASCDVMCGHSKCHRVCSEPCVPCAVPECLSSCPHSSCSMPCAAPCDHIPCSLRCEKLLGCGHRCPSVCGEACPAAIFCQICGSEEIKDTPVDFILGMTYREINLAENPCIFPQCGHFLTIESMDGQMDMRNITN